MDEIEPLHILSDAELNELNLAKENLRKKYKAVTGCVPTKRDLASWNADKFIHFFNFSIMFLRKKEEGESVFQTPEKKIREVENFLMRKDHPYHEFIFRMANFPNDPGFSPRKYYFKFAAFQRQIGKYLRENPAVITEPMRNLIQDEPRFSWCLRNIKIVETKIGAEVIAYDTGDNVTPTLGMPSGVVTHEQRYAEALVHSTSLFLTLSKSISRSDIMKMTPKDRIAALAKVAGIMSLHKGFKPGKSVFTQINIHGAQREQLEDAFLEFGKSD